MLIVSTADIHVELVNPSYNVRAFLTIPSLL